MLNSLTFFLMGVLAISEKDITQDYIFKHQGLWMHPSQQYVVRLAGCENGMCGTIAWVAENAVKHDVNNKDVTLRGRSLCGLRIVNGLATDGHVNIYKKGKIYRTDNGQTTSVKASYLSSDEVQVHSYQGVSMVGDSMIWTRVSEKDYPPCTPVAPKEVPMAVIKEMEDTSATISQENRTVSAAPVSLTPNNVMPASEVSTQNAVVQSEPQAATTNSNLKTKMVEEENKASQSFWGSSSKNKERPQARVLTLEVVE